MGVKLVALFARAHAAGGAPLAARLAFKTHITSYSAEALADTPQNLDLTARALEELMRSGAAPTAAKGALGAAEEETAGRADRGLVRRYFELARQHGGLILVVKLATRTGLTSERAANIPDAPEIVERARQALAELLPGVALPQ